MNIITVIPITKSLLADPLTYFTAKTVAPGAIVSIPIRKKNVPALVTEVKPASEARSALRSSDFSVRKVTEIITPAFFHPAFIQAVNRISHYSINSAGTVLKSLTPQKILDDAAELATSPSYQALAITFASTKTIDNRPPTEISVFQETEAERLAVYKSLIREEFAKKQSVFFCVPTVADIDHTASILERGITEHTIILHANLTKNELLKRWHQALTSPHPVLIVATPLFLSLPRADISLIIVDQESSASYRRLQRPYFDFRTFAELYAQAASTRLIFGDTVVRTETAYRATQGQWTTLSSLKYRINSDASQIVIRRHKTKTDDEAWRGISRHLAEKIQQAAADQERLFIFANRLGIAPITLCGDCGEIVNCDQCHSPLVVHRKKKLKAGVEDDGATPTIFICHKCQQVTETTARCKHCASWKLVSYGAGIDAIETELQALLPQTPILRLDSETIKNPKTAKALVEQFLTTKGSILLGTEMALHFLREPVSNVIVISVDPLLTLPDFRIKEKIFHLLIRLRALAKNRFVVQTKYETEPTIDMAMEGNGIGFYRAEIKDREQFNYPPASVLIKVSREGDKETIWADMERLAEQLVSYGPAVFPAFVPITKGSYRLHLLLKLPPSHWQPTKVDPVLWAILNALPPSYRIEVDPSDIL